jgi:hypothetical protein
MPFQLNEFRNQLQFDGARPNLFEVQITPPGFAGGPSTAGGVTDITKKTTFMCNAAQLPGSTLGIAPTYYFGREVKLAGNRTFADWTVTILNDEDFLIRNMMERWMDGMGSNAENLRRPSAAALAGASTYAVDAYVTQFKKTGTTKSFEIAKEYTIVGMFPIDISPIDLAWSSNDQVEEFQVTFALQHWEDSFGLSVAR